MPIVPEHLRYEVRDATARATLQQLCPGSSVSCSFEESAYNVLYHLKNDREMLPPAVRKQMSFTRYFIDPLPDSTASSAPAEQGFFTEGGSQPSRGPAYGVSHTPLTGKRKQDVYLLGQFDCLALPARADYSKCFERLPRGPPVTVPAPAAQAPVDGLQHPGNEDVTPPSDLVAWRQSLEKGGGGDTEGLLETHPADQPLEASAGGDQTNEHKNHSDSNVAPSSRLDRVLRAGSATDEHPMPDCDGPDGFSGWFWVVHAAAPNIGESANADDFVAYSREEAPLSSAAYGTTSCGGFYSSGGPAWGANGSFQNHYGYQHGYGGAQPMACWKAVRGRRRLDENLYVSHMGRLWCNVLTSMGRLDVDDAVVFPFGMGAFLRHLGQNDSRYNDTRNMKKLRLRIAEAFLDAVAMVCLGVSGKKSKRRRASVGVHGPARVHLCLVVSNPESVENHNCFLEAAAERAKVLPQLRTVLLLRRNVDSLQLAHDLSSALWQHVVLPKVAVLNGASRKLIGNHWFQSGARSAIDENLHRRSSSMARAALLLNLNTEPVSRRPLQLASHVARWGGELFRASDGKVLVPDGAGGLHGSGTRPRASSQQRGGFSGCCCSRRRTKTAPAHVAPGTAAGGRQSATAGGGHAAAGTQSAGHFRQQAWNGKGMDPGAQAANGGLLGAKKWWW